MTLELPDKEMVEALHKDVKDMKQLLNRLVNADTTNLIDNKAFCKLFFITPRTAQNWRDEGKVTFVQIGAKIWYRTKDVETFINSNLKKSF